MVCTLEISVSCVTEAEDEGHSSNSSSLEIDSGSKGLACFIREEVRCFKNHLSMNLSSEADSSSIVLPVVSQAPQVSSNQGALNQPVPPLNFYSTMQHSS